MNIAGLLALHLALLLSSQRAVGAADLQSEIRSDVKVGSTYLSLDKHGRVVQDKIQGTGVLVVDDGRLDSFLRLLKSPNDPTVAPTTEPQYFIVTAAHVAQGVNTWITIGSTPLKIIGRLADDRDDIELLQVESPPVPPVARFSWQSRQFEALFASEKNGVRQSLLSDLRVHTVEFKKRDGSDPYDGFLLTPLSDEGQPKRLAGKALTSFGYINLLGQYVANAKVVPGMSGAPLFLRNGFGPDEYFYLGGITAQYDRYRQLSFFTPAGKIGALVKKYALGQRGHVDEVRWRTALGTTYRDYGDGTVELRYRSKGVTLPSRFNSGNHTRGDGGDHDSSIGSADASLPTGMIYQNKVTYAFEVRFPGDNDPVVIDANSGSLELLKILAADVMVNPLGTEGRFLSVLQKRFSLDPRANNDPPVELAGRVKTSVPTRTNIASVNLQIGATEARLQILRCTDATVTDSCRWLTLIFDEFGTARCSGCTLVNPKTVFQPIVSLRQPGDATIVDVDLRTLFFIDPAVTRETGRRSFSSTIFKWQYRNRAYLSIIEAEHDRETPVMFILD